MDRLELLLMAPSGPNRLMCGAYLPFGTPG
jgi:hypothetical protein